MKTRNTLRAQPLAVVGLVPFLLLASACSHETASEHPESAATETPSPQPATAAELAQTLPEILEKAVVPGLGLAVVKEGEVVVDLGLGVTRAGTESSTAPVTVETIFEAASLSKPVFAYGVLQLVERGDLDLDRPLTSYMPYERVTGDERLDLITARHVLSHTTGFPNWARDHPLTIDFDPGARFSYSGEGFVFLQKVVEKLTEQPLDEYLRTSIFEPLGMESSSYVWQPAYDTSSATGHDLLAVSHDKYKPEEANAAASLHTTAGDFARFLREMMHPTLLQEATVTEMLTPQVETAEGISWGLGWGLEEVTLVEGEPAESLFWHWGDNGIFRCLTVASAERGLGVVYFTNSENGLTIAREILRRTVGGNQHPALAWQDYGDYDSPSFRIQKELLSAGLDGGADGVQTTYEALREELPADAFAENLLNRIGYNLLGRDAVDAAVVVFQHNTEAFPASWNVYDSLGEALMRRGDREQAIARYEKSLELNPENTNAEAMLEELRKQ